MNNRPNIKMLLSLAGLLSPLFATAQEPDRPDLLYVTVDPETGHDIIYWDPSPSPNVDYYLIGIAEPDPPPGDYHLNPVPGGQVFPPGTDFVNTNTESDLHPVGYAVWAVDDQGAGIEFHSDFDFPDSTMYLEVDYDECGTSFSLRWTDYNTWRGNILEYNIYRRTGPGVYVHLGTTDEGINTYFRSQLQPDQHFEIFVEAVHNDGRRSTSNLVTFETGSAPGPDVINADFATLGQNGGIDLSFTASSSEPYEYVLSRGMDPAGVFSSIQQFESQGVDSVFTFHDDISFTSGVYYYRLEVMNNCGVPGKLSNLANNILLNGTQDGMNIILRWNEYLDWEGGVQAYTVTRIAGVENSVVDIFPTGLTTSLNDDISSLADYSNPLENRICYQVEATENPNMYGSQGSSVSNTVCFTVSTGIRLPTAIIPNSGDVNNTFEPVFAFAPERYELIIYNRLGLKVWEGTNSNPWDGTINGSYAPEGVYLYYFRIYNYSADIIEMSGSVTVIYR